MKRIVTAVLAVMFAASVICIPEFTYTGYGTVYANADTQKQIATAQRSIDATMARFAAANDTTEEEALAAAIAGLRKDSRVTVTVKEGSFSIRKATKESEGKLYISFILSCDGEYFVMGTGSPIERIIEGDDKMLTEDLHEMSVAVDAMTLTNKTTKEDMLKVALAAAKNGSTAYWKDGFYKKDATFEAEGEIIGYLVATYKSETREVRYHEKIPMLVRKVPKDQISLNEEEWDILRRVNIERFNEGEICLAMPGALQDACDTRAKEIAESFSHTRPNGSSCFTAIKNFSYSTAGENIYHCPSKTRTLDTARAMTSWMESPGHRANILKTTYTYIGVGSYETGEDSTAVQMFAASGKTINSAVSSNGTLEFEDEEAMQKEYLIFNNPDGLVSYMPIDINYLKPSDGGYTLKLNSSFTVTLKIKNSLQDNTQKSTTGFSDVKPGDYYEEAVKWAVDNNVTTGTSATTFSPKNSCTKAQIITFLWRAVGAPKTDVSNPFRDVSASDYYYDAALWAFKNKIITGVEFAPNTPCTRSMTVTYLYKNAGKPDTSYETWFTDVEEDGSDEQKAVCWAVEKGITQGTSEYKFSPKRVCDRGQIVTFLYRALAK